MQKIEWKVTEQNISQELVSSDNRWHISKNQEGNESPKFFLSNYDLLLSPHGSGTNYRECFESFIAGCDAYVNKIKEMRAEAQTHLKELIRHEKELSHAN